MPHAPVSDAGDTRGARARAGRELELEGVDDGLSSRAVDDELRSGPAVRRSGADRDGGPGRHDHAVGERLPLRRARGALGAGRRSRRGRDSVRRALRGRLRRHAAARPSAVPRHAQPAAAEPSGRSRERASLGAGLARLHAQLAAPAARRYRRAGPVAVRPRRISSFRRPRLPSRAAPGRQRRAVRGARRRRPFDPRVRITRRGTGSPRHSPTESIWRPSSPTTHPRARRSRR